MLSEDTQEVLFYRDLPLICFVEIILYGGKKRSPVDLCLYLPLYHMLRQNAAILCFWNVTADNRQYAVSSRANPDDASALVHRHEKPFQEYSFL